MISFKSVDPSDQLRTDSTKMKLEENPETPVENKINSEIKKMNGIVADTDGNYS